MEEGRWEFDEEEAEEISGEADNHSPVAESSGAEDMGVSHGEVGDEEVGSSEATVGNVRGESDGGPEVKKVLLLPPPPKRAGNVKFPNPVILEEGDDFDVIEHPFEEGSTARFWHSNGGIRCDGSCDGIPGTYLISPDEHNAKAFYAAGIKTSKRGREVQQVQWQKSRQAMRDGIEKAVRKEKGIPVHLMTNEAATAVIAEVLTERVLDPDEPLRDVTKTAVVLLEKSQALPDARTRRDVPDVAILINIERGLLSGGFDED